MARIRTLYYTREIFIVNQVIKTIGCSGIYHFCLSVRLDVVQCAIALVLQKFNSGAAIVLGFFHFIQLSYSL